MILVDSSVWIDIVNGLSTIQSIELERRIIEQESVLLGDLMLAKVLQGTRSDRQFAAAEIQLSQFDLLSIADGAIARQSAIFYRQLRAQGITIRTTVGCLIATRCIVDGLSLLYRDRDFDPFVTHLGLVPALPLAFGVI